MVDKDKIRSAVSQILEAIGEDPQRPGLRDTPERVATMFEEIFSGIGIIAENELKVFTAEHHEMIIHRDIPFYSMCEHHLL
ncbi:MAG: GTP cyclohydrolase I, partial [Calditrichota bacterium]